MSENSPNDEGDPVASASASARITLDEYRRRSALGEFSGSKSAELLEGVIVPKARQSLRHEAALEKIQEVLGKLLPNGWHLRIQQPLATAPNSQPEPDAAVVRDALDGYEGRSPTPQDVAIVIEAADASLLIDRRAKNRIYARANIPNYWLLNLLDSQLEVFTSPSGPVQLPAYQEERTYRMDDRVDVVVLEDIGSLRVGDLMP